MKAKGFTGFKNPNPLYKKVLNDYQEPKLTNTYTGLEPQRRNLVEQTLDLGIWMEMAEGRCKRAGDLKKQLEKDKARLLRRMETLDMDKILTDLPTWWEKNLPEELSYQEMEPSTSIQTLSEGRLGARHPINKPNTTPRCQEVYSQDQAIHTSTRKQAQVKEEKSEWYSHLTGLIGWWRRVEKEGEKEGWAG